MEKESNGRKVLCYAGYRGDQRPLAFWMSGRRMAVTKILSAWIEPRQRCFKIRADDGARYLLYQDTDSLRWQVERMDAPPEDRES